MSFLLSIARSTIAKDLRSGHNRATGKITVINPNVRIALGIAILRMKDEMKHYDVPPPRGVMAEHWREWILPFVAGLEEIVGTWLWRNVMEWIIDFWATEAGAAHPGCKKTPKGEYNHSHACKAAALEAWYEAVALPKWKSHEQARLAKEPLKYADDGCVLVSSGGCVCNSN